MPPILQAVVEMSQCSDQLLLCVQLLIMSTFRQLSSFDVCEIGWVLVTAGGCVCMQS